MTTNLLAPWQWGRGRMAEPQGADVFSSLRREMDRLFEDFDRAYGLEPLAQGRETGNLGPLLDVSESGKALEVTAELPGVDEKDVELSVANGVMTIKAEKKDKSFYRVERSFGTYQRSIALPVEIDEDRIEASFDKGVLSVTLPKKRGAKPAVKHIEVKAA
jgi:HSP20 family protein